MPHLKSGEASKKRHRQLRNFKKGFTETLQAREGPSYRPGPYCAHFSQYLHFFMLSLCDFSKTVIENRLKFSGCFGH